MRKGKIITIYDIKLVLGFTGSLADSESDSVAGKITIPEVMHDNDEDDYVFEIEIFSDNKEKGAARDLITRDLIPRLRSTLQRFPEALTDAHGKDVLIASQAGTTPTVGTASNAQNAAAGERKTASKSSNSTAPQSLNVSSISETYEFQTLAKELYITFLDKGRLAAWTRAAPNVEAKVGGRISLFNGNIEGEFLELEENVKIVQTWRLQAWPAGHFAKLTLTFDQGLDGTNLRMVMTDIPIGQEDAVKNNFGECKYRESATFGAWRRLILVRLCQTDQNHLWLWIATVISDLAGTKYTNRPDSLGRLCSICVARVNPGSTLASINHFSVIEKCNTLSYQVMVFSDLYTVSIG